MAVPLVIVPLAMTPLAVVGQDVDRKPVKPSKPTVTFNSDIGPMIHKRCSSCHRPGQAGPFSLLDYKDVAKRAQTIAAVVESGYMPPWKPIDHKFEFSNDISLSTNEKEQLNRWIAAGKPRGSGDPPKPPTFKDGWRLGKPDFVVKMNGQFKIPASGPDVYRSFIFPVQFPEDKWVKAIEYRPTATSSVHHAIFFIDTSGNARAKDGEDGQPGIPGMGFLGNIGSAAEESPRKSGLLSRLGKRGSNDSQPQISKALNRGLGGYVPGSAPTRLPGDLAMLLPKGSDIVMQTHFHPSGKAESEQGEIALYFGDRAPSNRLVSVQVPAIFGIATGLKIPAGEANYTIRESFTLPTAVQVIDIAGHAHYICRHVKMTAELPDGTQQILLEIDDWDLDWQGSYQFKNQVILPKGTVLTSELIYDNSADNPENPNHPPKEIRWGRESEDEMGSVTIQTIAVDEKKRPQLESAVGQYVTSSLMGMDIVDLLMHRDENKDGALQKSEVPSRLAQRFRLLDRNRDQKLDRDELDTIRKFLPNPFRQGSKKRVDESTNKKTLSFRCLDGSELSPFENPKVKACALVFVSTDCPIANAYLPLLEKLQSEFAEKASEQFWSIQIQTLLLRKLNRMWRILESRCQWC